MSLAEQLKRELTQRACEANASKRLLEWVSEEFRKGRSEVVIYDGCYGFEDDPKLDYRHYFGGVGKEEKELEERIGVRLSHNVRIAYKDGKHFINGVDVSDLPVSQKLAFTPQDFSDKKFYLEHEGFNVIDYKKYGFGRVLEITL